MATRRIITTAPSILRSTAKSTSPIRSIHVWSRFVSAPSPVAGRRSVQAAIPLAPVVRGRWYSAGSGTDVEGSKIWSFDEVKKLVEQKGGQNNVVLVDVREPAELISTGKIPGAINIPTTASVQSFVISEDDFVDMYGFERPSRDSTLLFYCKAGIRAKTVAGLAKSAGWNNIGEYTGSWLDWEKQGGPVEKVREGHGFGQN